MRSALHSRGKIWSARSRFFSLLSPQRGNE